MQSDQRLSRPVSAAARLCGLAPDFNRFVDKRVLLTGERRILSTENGRESLLDSLRLLIRICADVSVAFPERNEDRVRDCRSLAKKIAFGGNVAVLDGMPNFDRYDAILSVGTAARPELPWTVINSNGWLARVSSERSSLPTDCGQANPVGALAAANLGVADVFKRLIRLKSSRGRLLDGLSFSLFSYQRDELDPGPLLPADLPVDLLLAGAGAIGNGIVHLLSRLPVSGRALVVDAQKFHEENLGTCILIGPKQLNVSKAKFAEGVLKGKLQANGFEQELESFGHHLGSEIPYPRVILTGLDNIAARHTAQNLWPDLVIDGAIGDFPCQVSRHKWGDDSACLICLFRHPPGPAAELVASRSSGLSAMRVQDAEDRVTERDVENAPAEKRTWLRRQVGQKICSVVQEAVAQEISQDGQQAGFAPSVPFVASMSACMVVTELIKHVAGWPTALDTRYQFDVLRGPASGIMVPQERRAQCVCSARAHNITAWRQSRLRPVAELQHVACQS